jgi:tRNA1Val (adenine37-N6)-methyltransferase
MPNTYFQFKEFIIHQEQCGMKVCTDSCVFGAWAANFAGTKNRILDIGAGTGLLMLMLAQKSSARIDGIEIEPGCYKQLKSNLASSPWADRLQAFAGDVRAFQFTEKYDLIISNPPFFSSDLLSKSGSNRIARHSIELSLQELFTIVTRRLTVDGNFALLLPFHRLEEAREMSMKSGLKILQQVNIFSTPEHKPFRVIFLFGNQPGQGPEMADFVIKKDGSYTTEFSSILKGYYLAL